MFDITMLHNTIHRNIIYMRSKVNPVTLVMQRSHGHVMTRANVIKSRVKQHKKANKACFSNLKTQQIHFRMELGFKSH